MTVLTTHIISFVPSQINIFKGLYFYSLSAIFISIINYLFSNTCLPDSTPAIESNILNFEQELCRLGASMYVGSVSSYDNMNEFGSGNTANTTTNNTTTNIFDNDTGYFDGNDNDSSSTHILQTTSTNSYHIHVDKPVLNPPADKLYTQMVLTK
ncbi:unnamed protein product [Schistosoma spindalis]|nr:unnamed protein product [Schistosoma spindale]